MICSGFIQLEYIIARHVLRACTGEGTGEILEAIWFCRGNESMLNDCNKTLLSKGTCDHRRDAGVYCSG